MKFQYVAALVVWTVMIASGNIGLIIMAVFLAIIAAAICITTAEQRHLNRTYGRAVEHPRQRAARTLTAPRHPEPDGCPCKECATLAGTVERLTAIEGHQTPCCCPAYQYVHTHTTDPAVVVTCGGRLVKVSPLNVRTGKTVPCTEGGPCRAQDREITYDPRGNRVGSVCTECNHRRAWLPYLTNGAPQ